MSHYWVMTPVYTYVEPVLDDGSGPRYDTRDVVCVAAPNKREARKEAVKTPEFRRHVNDCRSDRVPPFKGLEVEDCLCEHGFCWCEIPDCHPDEEGCPTCLAKDRERWEAEDRERRENGVGVWI